MADVDLNPDRLRHRNGRLWQHQLEGRSVAWIAENYGLRQSEVKRILEEVRANIPPATALTVKQLDLERLDALLPAFFTQAIEGDSNALRSVLSIMERRAKLLGLDSPVQIQGEQTVRYVIEGLSTSPQITAEVVEVADTDEDDML